MEWMLLPFKRYFDFSGRSRRKEYWMFSLFLFLVYIVLGGVVLSQLPWAAMMASSPGASPSGASPFAGFQPSASLFISGGLIGLFALGSFIPAIAVAVRRFHDQDMSGWFVLLFMVLGMLPYIGFLASIANLVFMARKGTAGSNRFGADPLDPTYAGVFE